MRAGNGITHIMIVIKYLNRSQISGIGGSGKKSIERSRSKK